MASLYDGAAGVYLVGCMASKLQLDASAAYSRSEASSNGSGSSSGGNEPPPIAGPSAPAAGSDAAGSSGDEERDTAAQRLSACLQGYLDAGRVALLHCGLGGDEPLYGRAGYLLGLTMLQRLLGREAVPDAAAEAVVDAIVASGRRTAQQMGLQSPPLMYFWPEQDGDPYLGAAHGLMGICYALMSCNAAMARAPDVRAHVLDCMWYILEEEQDVAGREGQGGHWPVMCGERGALLSQRNHPSGAAGYGRGSAAPGGGGARPLEEEPLVHWCHGSSGAVLVFCKAFQVFGEQAFLDAALRAGDLIWERGLLRKGLGLCHGISGSGYALLCLYKATRDPRHAHRALQFGFFMCSAEGKAIWDVPDAPLSLYEGRGGAACFLADLLQPESAAFPLFEAV